MASRPEFFGDAPEVDVEEMMTFRMVPTASLVIVFAASTVAAQTSAPSDDHARHVMQTPAAQAPQFTRPANDKVPPGIAEAAAELKSSKLKNEWVDIPYGAGPVIKSFVVYPERREKAPVVIVIHEIFGLTEWIRGVAEQLAEDGYIAVAPDFLSGMGPGGGGTAEIGGDDAARKVIAGLTPAEAMNRLNAVHAYAMKIPGANGKTATIGYCWGGARSFEAAVNVPELDAAIVFYGTSPANAPDLAKIKAPVLGLYGADDARVNATIEPASAEMKKLGKVYEFEIYEGAGHGFLRAQGDRGGANYQASEKAWSRVLAFLQKYTK
jgi:carboxymethylenebutenolidase